MPGLIYEMVWTTAIPVIDAMLTARTAITTPV